MGDKIRRLTGEELAELLKLREGTTIDEHGRLNSLDEIWHPVGSVIEYTNMAYDEAVTIGGQFGILISEIERMRRNEAVYLRRIAQLEKAIEEAVDYE